MPRLVLDASIVVKWLNPYESLADKANLIRDGYEQGQVSLLVPAFWDYEVVNGINKAVARGDLSDEEGREAMALLLTVDAQREPLPSPQASYNLARKYQRSVYDSWYLDVAERAGCEFWTADQKLYNAMKDKVSFIRWLEDYRAHPSPRPSSS
ncbi:MAG TPA: type II toxin-antitoxin system VapC family toxin [Alphaproteobacteria bacterium]|nr:type II toxin-antitoxin system VapC family toxin [Alphaproteobacteria bacterium]